MENAWDISAQTSNLSGQSKAAFTGPQTEEQRHGPSATVLLLCIQASYCAF